MAEFRLSNFTSGAVLTAAELNTGLTYASYTPDWTQSATITKTVNWARYTQFGKMVMGSIKMTATGAGTANNRMIVSLPVSASADNFMIGSAIFIDDSTAPDEAYRMFAVYESSTTMSFIVTYGAGGVDATLRFGNTGAGGITVASNDVFNINFQYEAA